jgi:hypothetical protein
MLLTALWFRGRLRIRGDAAKQIDRFEINEGFGAQVLAMRARARGGPRPAKFNGGAIAIGHLLGAIGVPLGVTLASETKAICNRKIRDRICRHRWRPGNWIVGRECLSQLERESVRVRGQKVVFKGWKLGGPDPQSSPAQYLLPRFFA